MTGSDEVRVLFAGGGTAGHLMPAINVAVEMVKIDKRVKPLFAGRRGGIEKNIASRFGFVSEEIDVVPLKRSPLGLVRFVLNWNSGNRQAAAIISAFDPAAVVGTGGYICAPFVRAAAKSRKPIFLQEQNSLPGLALRSVAKYAELIFLAYDSALRYFDDAKCRIVGNPVRPDINDRERKRSKEQFGLDPSKNTLLILGGSSGASGINKAVGQYAIGSIPGNWQVLWQTGNRDFGEYHERLSGRFNGAIIAFIDDMPSAYAAADLVLSRAGAMALSEITAAGLPSVLVPYPHATGDHQTLNARHLESANAAVILPEAEIESKLAAILNDLMANDEVRMGMSDAARSAGKPGAAAVIAKTILERI